MTWPELILFSAIAYLVGAIPFSWLFVRWLKGVDLRTVGSGNLGSTNAMRVLGPAWGLCTQALDILKGWLPVSLPLLIVDPKRSMQVSGWDDLLVVGAGPPVPEDVALLAIGTCAVLGHMFPVYLRFRGGKGVNTSLGVFLALAPKAILVALAAGLILLAFTRIVSVCSITGAVVFPFAAWFFYRDQIALIVVAVITAALVVVLHRSNIRRLLAGQEPRLGGKSATEESGEPEAGHSEG